jgi:hypothetical protein
MAEQQKPQASTAPAHTPGTEKGESKKKKVGKEAGRADTGTSGRAKRPAGKSSGRTSTGINPKKPVDPQSPNLPTP